MGTGRPTKNSYGGYLILYLPDADKAVRIDVLESDEHAFDAGTSRFLYKIRKPVAQCIHLDGELDTKLINLTQIDETILA